MHFFEAGIMVSVPHTFTKYNLITLDQNIIHVYNFASG